MEIVEIIQPSGKLTSNSLNLLHNEIRVLIVKGVKLILIDFQDAIALDIDAVEILESIADSVISDRGELYLCSLNQEVEVILDSIEDIQNFTVLKNRQEFEETILAIT